MRNYNEDSLNGTLEQFYRGCSKKESQLPFIIKDIFSKCKENSDYQTVLGLWISTFNKINRFRYKYFEPLDDNCKEFYINYFRSRIINIFNKFKIRVDKKNYKDLLTHSECLMKAFIRETQNNFQNNKG